MCPQVLTKRKRPKAGASRKNLLRLSARILSVVDAYSAITDDRPYKRARTHDEAIGELRQCAGTQFDPHVVDVFCRIVRERGAAVQ